MNRRDLLKIGVALPLMPAFGKIEIPKEKSDLPFASINCGHHYCGIKVIADGVELDTCTHANTLNNEYSVWELDDINLDYILKTYNAKHIIIKLKTTPDTKLLIQKRWYDDHIDENYIYYNMKHCKCPCGRVYKGPPLC